MSKTVRFNPADDAGTQLARPKPKRFRDARDTVDALVDFAQVRMTPAMVLEIAEVES